MANVQHFTLNPVQENTYIVYDSSGECVLIDPGCHAAQEEKWLEQFIRKMHLKPVRCLLTHAHFDHVFGCDWVYETYGLQPEMHAGEQLVWDNVAAAANRWGFNIQQPHVQPLYISENNPISFGQTTLLPLFVPGHSPASLCFYCAKSDFVIAGDTLFDGAIGRTDFPGSSHQLLLNSIKNELFTLPEKTIVYAGHGKPTSIGKEKQTNPFFV